MKSTRFKISVSENQLQTPLLLVLLHNTAEWKLNHVIDSLRRKIFVPSTIESPFPVRSRVNLRSWMIHIRMSRMPDL